MSSDQKKIKFIQWQVAEYKKPERGQRWYIIASITVTIALFLCFFSVSMWKIEFLGPGSNFQFALIIVMSIAIMTIHDAQETKMITIKLGPNGIHIGRRFYDYDKINTFCRKPVYRFIF